MYTPSLLSLFCKKIGFSLIFLAKGFASPENRYTFASAFGLERRLDGAPTSRYMDAKT